MVDVEYLWAVTAVSRPGDAVAVLGSVPPALGTSRSCAVTRSNGSASVSDATALGTSRSCAVTRGDATATRSSLSGLEAVVDPTIDGRQVFVDRSRNGSATVGTATAIGESRSVTVTRSNGTGGAEGSYAVTGEDRSVTVTRVEVRGTIASRTAVQRGNIARVREISAIEETAKAEMTIYLGMALSRVVGVLVPLRAGEPFYGFAIEYADAHKRRVFYASEGLAQIENVQGASSQADYDRIVYANNDTSFTTTNTGTPIGRLGNHLGGRWFQVRFQGVTKRSI